MKRLKRLLAASIMLLCAGHVFALEDYVSDVYHEIDTAFQQKSESGLNVVLQENQGDKYYYLMENYATKKVRRLIITNDYEFAMNAVLVIIDNNLDNTDAVEMYALISEAFEEQRAAEREAILEQERAQAKLAASKEEQRSNVEKSYDTVTAADGQKVFQKKDQKMSSNVWQFRFGIIDGDLVTNKSDDFMDFKYGISAAFDYEHQKEDINLGFDAYGAFHLSFARPEIDNTMLLNLELMPKISFNRLWDRFFVRAGLVALPVVKNAKAASADLFGTFITPAVGVGIGSAPIGSAQFSLNADYYPGHFFYKDLNAAMGFGANICIPYAEMDRIKLTFNFGVKDYLFIKNNGIENRAKIIIAIGAENVIR